MYIFDTNVFITLGNFYPGRFPTIWEHINELASKDDLISSREVYKELDNSCGEEHINIWVENNKYVFKIPTNEECIIVTEIFKERRHRSLVKKKNIQVGRPVADPFLIAMAKIRNGIIITQEAPSRMPEICKEFGVICLNLEVFFEKENLKF